VSLESLTPCCAAARRNQEENTKPIPLSDTSPMPFGKYGPKPKGEGRIMRDVPASYLFWLWTEGGKERAQNDLVADYIRANLATLKEEHPDGIW